MKRVLLIKCSALSVLLLGGQLLFAVLTGFKDVPSSVKQIENDLASGADILYFGDSTLYRGDASEADRRTLPGLLQSLLPKHSVGGAYHDAYHLGLLEHFVRRSVEHENPPKVIVLPVNMHSFSIERTKRPEYQFVKETLFLSHTGLLFRAFYRPLAVFKAFDLEPVTQAEYDNMMTYDGDTPLGTFAEIAQLPDAERLPIHVRATYGYRLDTTHPQIQALDRIAAMCTQADIQLLVYATPMDYERGDALIGEQFSENIVENLKVVENTLAAHGIPLLNLARTLNRDLFAPDTHGYPDAYLNVQGKEIVAQKIATTIQ